LCNGWGMAHIDDSPAQLLAGQARRVKEDARKAEELIHLGRIDEARQLVARNAGYAQAIWCELDYLTGPPREPEVRGKSRSR
jgi:hypothetical protein